MFRKKQMKSEDFLAHVSSILTKSTRVVEKVREKVILRKLSKEPAAQHQGDNSISSKEKQQKLLPTLNEKILRIAHLELGTKESKGVLDNDRVVEYHRHASKSNTGEYPDSVPWCSSFICWVVEKAGGKSTNSMAARSWMTWGESSVKDPMPGDIVVFWRGKKSGWQGHVAIFLRRNQDGTIACLGGNQNDEVNITFYSDRKLLGIRRDPGVDQNQGSELLFLVGSILNGEYINSSKKVV